MTNEELINNYRKLQNEQILEEIVEKNEGLIHFVMKNYSFDEVEREDLLQEGQIGLLKAINKFDMSRGSFSTYAVIHIRGSISRYIEQKVKKYLNVDSLNDTIKFQEGNEIEIIDTLEDDLDIEELIKDKLYNKELLEVIRASCSDLERQAMYLYYYANLTHLQVKERLQLSNAEQSRTIVDRAIRKIRRSKWFQIEYKEIRERQVDRRTNFIRNQRYDTFRSGNSHRGFYSSVENLVLERERIRMSM